MKNKQRLFRFELAFDTEPQNIGFLQGLADVNLDPELTEILYAPFNTLPIHAMDYNGRISCWFTETGLDRFANAINQIIIELTGTGWSLIGAVIHDDLSESLYFDKYQAFFSYEYIAEIHDYDFIEIIDVKKFKESE